MMKKLVLLLCVLTSVNLCALADASETSDTKTAEIGDSEGKTYYYVFFGAFTSVEAAYDHMDPLSSSDFSSVYKCMVDGKVVYRCGNGPFANRAQAERSKQGYIDGYGYQGVWICPSKVKFPKAPLP